MGAKEKPALMLSRTRIMGYEPGIYKGVKGPVAVISGINSCFMNKTGAELEKELAEMAKPISLDSVAKAYAYVDDNGMYRLAQAVWKKVKDLELLGHDIGLWVPAPRTTEERQFRNHIAMKMKYLSGNPELELGYIVNELIHDQKNQSVN